MLSWQDDGAHSIARADDGAHLHVEAALFEGIFAIEIVAGDGTIAQHVLHRATRHQAKAKAEAMAIGQ
jgi:hypothetical protein